MQRAIMNTSVTAAALLLAGATAASAAVVTNLATVTGANAIDPAATGQTIDFRAAGSASEAALEARTDFRAVQNFSGFRAVNFDTDPGPGVVPNGPTNIADFPATGATAAFPDVLFTVGGQPDGNTAGGGASFGGSPFSTSGSDYVSLSASNAVRTVTYAIDFGTNGPSGFDGGAVAVDAAAFTLSNLRAGKSVSVVFFNDAGAALSTQTAVGADVTSTTGGDTADDGGTNFTGLEGYFAFDVAGAATGTTGIGSILITQTATANGSTVTGFDDFGFTNALPVPEPTGFALLGVGGLLALRRRCRMPA